MKITRKNRKSVKRADRAIIREAFANRTLVSALGVVRKFPGEESHFEISTENGSREILVDVELMPHQERIQCRLAYGSDGVYKIPRVDTEVAVLIPMDPQSLVKDELDGQGFIVGIMDTEAPADLDEGTAVLEAPAINLGAGAIEPVILGETRKTAETTFLAALEAFCSSVSAVPTVGAAAATLLTAATTFKNSLTTHLSQVVKVK